LEQPHLRLDLMGRASDYDEAARSKAAKQVAQFQSLRRVPPAFAYKMTNAARVLLQWRSTFWPLVTRRFEFWLYPTMHIALIIYADTLRDDPESPPLEVLWGKEWQLPWKTLSLVTPLLIFFLVFFIGQCYGRFENFRSLAYDIETAVTETACHISIHIKDPLARWDVLRYLTASGVIIYFRVVDLANHQEAMVDACEFERILMDEREWLELGEDAWEKNMGWPRTREQGKMYTEELHKQLGLANVPPPRHSTTPPLLTRQEIETLRVYPGGMMSLVLQTWALQRAKATGDFDDAVPAFNTVMASVFKLRNAAYAIRGELSMPVPLPYFHSLCMLQNVNYLVYSFAMLTYKSNLTPLILLTFIVVTLGMREVAAALAIPFGNDDVDFPVNKYITQLRAIALLVHPSNVPLKKPPRAA